MKKVICILLAVLLMLNATCALAWGESNSEKYEKALGLLVENKYAEAGAAFADLGSYQDAPRYVMYCSAIVAGESGQYSVAVENLSALNGFLDSGLLAVYYSALSYEKAEQYERATEIFGGISLYRDVTERLATYPGKILERDYRIADGYDRDGRLEKALSAFIALGNYRDSAARAIAVQAKIDERDAAEAEAKRAAAYEAADQAEQEGKLEAALAGFTELGNYRDSAERAVVVQKKIEERNAAEEEAQRAAAYEAADQAEKNEDFAAAYTGFTGLGNYRDSADRAAAVKNKGNYALGIQYALAGKFSQALETFTALGDYEDSAEKAYALGVASFAKIENKGNGVAAFQYHDLWGVINVNTNTIVSPYWQSISSFNEHGLAIVTKDGYQGYINTQGEVIIPCEWKAVSNFAGDFCTVMKGSGSYSYNYGIVDKQGNIIIPADYAVVGNSTNGYYSNCTTPQFYEGRIKVQDNSGNWGFIDEQGRTIGTISWKFIDNFSEGLAAVHNGSKYGFVDKEGNVIIAPQYDDYLSFSEGLAAVKNGNSWQYINQKNQVVIPARYSDVTSFKGGHADVFLPGTGWQIIDNTGELLYFINQQTVADYERAKQLMAEEKYGDAYNILLSLLGYKDADALAAQCMENLDEYVDVSNVGIYGFKLNGAGYYESQNKGVDSSYALCCVDFLSLSGHVYIDCINYAEAGYDYGIISRPGQQLRENNDPDSGVTYTFSGSSDSKVQTIHIEVEPGVPNSIWIKYRKDGSGSSGNDSFQFNIRFR